MNIIFESQHKDSRDSRPTLTYETKVKPQENLTEILAELAWDLNPLTGGKTLQDHQIQLEHF